MGIVNPPDGVEEAVLTGEVPLVEPPAYVHRVAAEIGEGVATGAPQKRSGHALFNNTKMDSDELTAKKPGRATGAAKWLRPCMNMVWWTEFTLMLSLLALALWEINRYALC